MNNIIALIILAMSANVFAGEDKKAAPEAAQIEMMKKWEAAATPGEPHKKLAEYAGNWSYTSKLWMDEKGKPAESKGTSTFTSVLNGRYLQQNFKGEMMGQPYEGIGFVGYDNVKGVYQSTWMDSMGTAMMRGEGKMEKKTLKETATMSCPFEEDKTREMTSEWTFKDKNTMTFSLFGLHPGGTKVTKQMEITYKRIK